ncbi:hypothetical protein MKX83_00940 [Cytobacillus sp. FSL M8-0252]|uniref:hypothetical protein n=1 Tax=Cytobacillus sp. FSL M8-0252 TaxID=2921621 RepID=UPI0030F6FBF7
MINDQLLLKLYIPAVAKDQDKIQTFIYKALYPVLQQLFGRDLWSVKVRESSESERFGDARETILRSVNTKESIPA